MTSFRISRAAAIHEAAHAVARIYVGAPATSVEVAPRRGAQRQGGLSHGTGMLWTSQGTGQDAAWEYLTVIYAGGLAEARSTKRCASTIFLCGGGYQDYLEAQPVLEWLVSRGFAMDTGAAERRAKEDCRDMLRAKWAAVEAVATALQGTDRLSAHEVLRLVPNQAA